MSTSAVNKLRDGLSSGEFLVTLEFCLPEKGESLKSLHTLAEYAAGDPLVHAVALTDRVTSENDYDSIETAIDILQRSGKTPLVHLSGKDCAPADMKSRLNRCKTAGLDNVLLVTGDMPRPKEKGMVIEPGNGFVDSVYGVHLAREVAPDSLIATGVSSFKYTEPELMGQYIKLEKKIAHGAGLIFNQVGYDLRKTQELAWYLKHSGNPVPLMAALYWLAPGFAKFALAGNVPGVLISEDLCKRVEEICTESDKGQSRRVDMMAIHIALCRHFGYRGVHVGGLKTPDTISKILKRAEEMYSIAGGAEELWKQWCGHLTFLDGRMAETGEKNGFYLFEPETSGLNSDRYAQADSNGEIVSTYFLLRRIHDIVFDKGLKAGGIGEKIVRGLAHIPFFDKIGYAMERAVKYPLVGCQGCGSCSLPDTEYVCIESKCAKHLTNGPCGGQRDGQCEAYPERVCAWAEIYRRAKRSGNLEMLKNRGAFVKDRSLKHTCSWINLCTGRDHHATERKSNFDAS